MKAVLLMVVALALSAAEQTEATLERFTLTDGRELVGWYDDNTATLTLPPTGGEPRVASLGG